jgi:hypothetical protein
VGGFLSVPDPVSIFESAKNAGLEREIANSFVSAAYSAWISAMWRSGSAKWAVFTGEGQAMKDAATAMYLSLRELEKKNFLVLTVPEDMLAADNLSRFQTEERTK